ncbi:DUF3039 domain-containing protein [Kibdelosporangium persicum]
MPATASAATRPMWVVSIVDDAEHAVTRDDLAAGIASGSGTYRALCQATVIPPSMTEPPGSRCPYCTAVLRLRRRTTA